jgi:hypothetical protein
VLGARRWIVAVPNVAGHAPSITAPLVHRYVFSNVLYLRASRFRFKPYGVIASLKRPFSRDADLIYGERKVHAKLF